MLRLWDDLAPHVERKRCCRASEDADEMILPCLECALCYVASMVLCGDQLIYHADFLDYLLVRLQYLVV